MALHIHVVMGGYAIWDTETGEYITSVLNQRDLREAMVRWNQREVLPTLPKLLRSARTGGCSMEPPGRCDPIPPLWTSARAGIQLAMTSLLVQMKDGRHKLSPPANEADLSYSEAKLGFALPDGYREFVTLFSNGAWLYSCQQVASVGEQPRPDSVESIHDGTAAWFRRARREGRPAAIPYRDGPPVPRTEVVPFSPDHNGNAWCLRLPKGDVYYWNASNDTLYARLNSFEEWLAILVRFHDEVIRSVSTRNVIYDELALG